ALGAVATGGRASVTRPRALLRARGGEPVAGGVEAAGTDAGATRVTVVHEHGEPAGGGVACGGDASDVPSIAGREEREQADRAVLGGMRGSWEVCGEQA